MKKNVCFIYSIMLEPFFLGGGGVLTTRLETHLEDKLFSLTLTERITWINCCLISSLHDHMVAQTSL